MYGSLISILLSAHIVTILRQWYVFARKVQSRLNCHVFQWREISKILEGVIRIGAVNCQDEWMMCNEQGIQGYPTLRIYPKVKELIFELH